MEAAAIASGVARSTFFDWLTLGRQEDSPKIYRDFVRELDEALALFEVDAMGRIAKAGSQEWQADAWRLERRYPERYGRRTRIDGQVEVRAIVASPEWLELRDRVLEALTPFPEALEAVLEAIGAADVVAREVVLELTA